jgi:hypothetical protein
MTGQNAWDNGSWIRTPGDVKFWSGFEAQEAKELIFRLRAEERKAARRASIFAGPERAVKQYQNAVRKIGLIAVAEALGLG